MNAGVKGRKRKRLLGLLGVYLDLGRAPSITELCERMQVPRVAVVALLDDLEADGLISIQRGNRPTGERSTYRFLLPEFSHTKTQGAAHMTTSTKIKTNTPLLAWENRPAWAAADWMEERIEGGVPWPRYQAARERHVAAVERAESALNSPDEAAAILDLATAAIEISEEIKGQYGREEYFEAWMEAAREIEATRPVPPPGIVVDNSHPHREAAANWSATHGRRHQALRRDRTHMETVLGEGKLFAFGAKGVRELAEARLAEDRG